MSSRKPKKPPVEILTDAGKKILPEVNDALGPSDVLDVLRMWQECKRDCEAEKTKREEIRAKRDVAVAAIDAQRELLQSFFAARFSERKHVLDGFFGLMHHAVESKDNAQLDTALKGILGVLEDSPLKDLDAFRVARSEGKTIEI